MLLALNPPSIDIVHGRASAKASLPKIQSPYHDTGPAISMTAILLMDAKTHARRYNSPSSPELRQRYIRLLILLRRPKPPLHLRQMLMYIPLPNHTTLPTRPRAQPTPNRPTPEILLTLLPTNLLHLPQHPNLLMHLPPIKHERSVRVRLQFAGLARGVVRVEDEAFVVELFEEDDAGGGDPGGGGGGEGHGFGFVDFGGEGGEPGAELVEGVGGDGLGGEHVRGLVGFVVDDLDLVGVGVDVFRLCICCWYGVHGSETEEM